MSQAQNPQINLENPQNNKISNILPLTTMARAMIRTVCKLLYLEREDISRVKYLLQEHEYYEIYTKFNIITQCLDEVSPKEEPNQLKLWPEDNSND